MKTRADVENAFYKKIKGKLDLPYAVTLAKDIHIRSLEAILIKKKIATVDEVDEMYFKFLDLAAKGLES